VELSFMPGLMASGNKTIMWYKGNITPPKSWADWYTLIVELATHLVDRYGIKEVSQWNFEVWNEPNCGFWSGTIPEYFQLYNTTARALKSVNPALQVGGPATCMSGLIPEFLDFVLSNDVPLDFVATHEYPTDPNCGYYGCMGQITAQTRKNVTALVGSNVPLYYSEFNDGLGSSPPYHDTSYASGFLFKNMPEINGNVDFISWWTFSDIFEEPGFLSSPYGTNTNWGLLNVYGVPKPSYRAFELLHLAGTQLVKATPSTQYETVGLWSTLSPVKGNVQIFAFNSALPGAPIVNQTVCVTIEGVSSTAVEITRIDSTHANPYAKWIQQGSPQYPTPEQNQEQYAASEIKAESLVPLSISTTTTVLSFQLEPQSVAYIHVRMQ